MKTRKITAVMVILLLLLAAAVANFFFVNRLYDQTMAEIEARESGQAPDEYGRRSAARDVPRRGSGHNLTWGGNLQIEPRNGGYDLIATAVSDGRPLPLEAVTIDARRAGQEKAEMTPALQKDDQGRFVAHVDLAPGEWEVRVRMHRPLQTFEFTRRFTAK